MTNKGAFIEDDIIFKIEATNNAKHTKRAII